MRWVLRAWMGLLALIGFGFLIGMLLASVWLGFQWMVRWFGPA